MRTRVAASLASLVVGLVVGACGAPASTGPGAATAPSEPCGLTPAERAAPVVSGVEYVPPPPSASVSPDAGP